ncbi:MAG: ATP-binding protein [Acidimicrobiaceae bacterium]|nr:ATP-binding protein [Acidimicrobiaceae bacterium]MDE0496781.1 ATP-binding protein [Acidimicrobiaceae bacterium]
MTSSADDTWGLTAAADAPSPRLRHAFFARLEEVRRPAALTPRRVAGRSAFAGKATAVVGMRRAGKTTYLHQLRSQRSAAGTPDEHLPFITLEDERLNELDAPKLGALIDEYTDRHRLAASASAHVPMCWFLDEIQVVPGWERLVRRLIDADGTEVFVSGSSAALLSREIATELRGRAWQVLMHPFGFDEALRHSGVMLPESPRLMRRAERARVEDAFVEWLDTGGFPEAQGLDVATRRRLLTDYVDVALLRDVIDRHGITNVVGLRWLARQLLANAGAMFSVEKFHRSLRSQGIAIARDTVHQHLSCLEDSFLVRTVWMEAASVRQRMVNPRKAYPIDAGLISVYDRTGRANTGHALETAVLIELERRGSEVTYVRTPEGFEVDFLARHLDGTVELIQVCADATEAETGARELRALATAGQAFPSARQSLLTLGHRGLPAEVPTGVDAQPAYEWILAAAVEAA